MSAPRKKAPPPPERKVPPWLSHPAAIVTSLTILFGGLSYSCGSVRDWLAKYDLVTTGAELAHKLDPQVKRLNDVVTQQVDLSAKQDHRITLSEKNVNELRKLRELEQTKQDATQEFQRVACAEGKLARDACRSLGFAVPGK